MDAFGERGMKRQRPFERLCVQRYDLGGFIALGEVARSEVIRQCAAKRSRVDVQHPLL